jgi:PAS domain S-box-containing protein
VRKQADEMRNRLAAIVESAEDAIISNDLNGTISSWNAGAQQVFGYSAEEAIGQPINMLIPAELQDEEPEILEKINCGERIDRYETVRLHKSGARVNISLIISPLLDSTGKVIGASKIARDITERIRLEVAVAAAMEEERGRIARDLHDGVGQQLGGALFLSDLVQRDLKQRGATEGARAAEVYALVTKALAQVREVSRGLYPVSPEPDGLMAALQNLADRVARDRGIDCTFDADSAVLLSDGALATHLYRIAQEAVNNSLKHSGSRRIEIQLAKTARFVTLSIHDYGTGLHKGTFQGGLGVQTMRDRARLIGGQLKFHNFQNGEGGGLEVICFVRKGWAVFSS